MDGPNPNIPENAGQPAFDVAGALKAGYSPTEIAQHLSQTNKFDYAGAAKAGYSDTDIINHLVPQGNPITGVVETVLNKASGVVAKPLGDIAGLAATGYDAVTGNKDGDAAGFKNYVQNQFTYSPRTQAGMNYNNATNTALANTVGKPGEWVGKGVKAVTGNDIAAGASQEATNQALGILGAKVLPGAVTKLADASAAPAASALGRVADASDWVTDKAHAIMKNKYVTGTAGVDAAMTALINPHSIPVMVGAGAAGGALYGANRLLGGAARSGSEQLGEYAARTENANNPNAMAPPATAGSVISAQRTPAPVSESTPGPQMTRAQADQAGILQPGASYPPNMVLANAIRQAPQATQAASTGANNAAAAATTNAVDTATIAAGRTTPTKATQTAVVQKVTPLTAAQADAAWQLQKMGLKIQTATELVRKVDPSITNSAGIQIAALRARGQ